MKTSRPYFTQLDGVRAIALLMVMVFHILQHQGRSGIAFFGQTGVDLFFVLSGFLITTILLLAPQRDWHEVGTFYVRRVLRIFPLYYVVLIVLAVAVSAPPLNYWLYVDNFAMARGNFQGPIHFWSLAVEEQFYLVQPFIVLFLPRRHLLKAFAAILVLATVSKFALVAWTRIDIFYFTACRLDALRQGPYWHCCTRRAFWRQNAARWRSSVSSPRSAWCWCLPLSGDSTISGPLRPACR